MPGTSDRIGLGNVRLGEVIRGRRGQTKVFGAVDPPGIQSETTATVRSETAGDIVSEV